MLSTNKLHVIYCHVIYTYMKISMHRADLTKMRWIEIHEINYMKIYNERLVINIMIISIN